MIAALLAAGAAAWNPISRCVYEVRLAAALHSARLAASEEKSQPAQLSDRSGDTWLSFIAGRVPARRHNRVAAASRLLRLAKDAGGNRAVRARGTAYFAAGDCVKALETLESLTPRDARDWNDLAAVQLCVARSEGRADRSLAALASVGKALAMTPSLAEARFNRARTLEEIGAFPLAQREWHRYLRLKPHSTRSSFVQERLAPLPMPERDAWRAATVNLADVRSERLANLTRTYPESARRFAEGAYLALWAEKMKERQTSDASHLLEQIRVIGRTLEQETGEALLADTVRYIDENAGRTTAALFVGLIAYRDGRRAYASFNFAAAEENLARSASILRRVRCPLWKIAEFYRAAAIGDQHRTDEALHLLRSHVAADGAPVRHKAFLAHTRYQIALIEAIHGRWSASLAAASDAVERFSQLRERENAAAARALLSEDYDLIGQREAALNHGVASLREACAAGDFERARVTLAVLCRIQLRAMDAEGAHALTVVEAEMARFAPSPRLDPDMYVRRATADWHLGRPEVAVSTKLARDSAKAFTDRAVRAKLLADVDAAEGTFVLKQDPRRAISLLSSAIAFQRQAARAVILPELYLQRGRAYLTFRDDRAASADFEAGIAELERQRSGVTDAEMRPGIFDDALELFDEAIGLQIRLGAEPDGVLRYVERGRARAVMEQISGRDGMPVPPVVPAIDSIQQQLAPASAFLAYVSLPDRLVVFVITRDRAVMRTIAITRTALMRVARAFTDGRGTSGSALHGIVIAPLREDLSGVSTINVSSDDILQRVPFAALFDPITRTFLVERYAIASSPSAGVFLATLARARALPRRNPTSAVIFGNPTIPRREFGNLPSLTASAFEAALVARPYTHAEVVTDDAATAERFVASAPRHEVVHFAGHGVVNEREPSESALVFAATARRAGAVTSRDIAQMRFRSTHVVVLAACSTMTGRNAAVEGVPSLARAFVVAGVPSVVGTLWDVEDSEAAAVIRPLHEQLARGAPPAVALRTAQLGAIRQRLPPSRWSAFALMGYAD